MMERQTVSIMKACDMVGVSRRTIYNWIAANKLEYVRTAGGGIRIFVDTLWREPDEKGPKSNLEARDRKISDPTGQVPADRSSLLTGRKSTLLINPRP